jgi:hypothetical protein
MATPSASITTSGGCSFDELCRNAPAIKNYVCDESCLVDLSTATSIGKATRVLVNGLENVFSNLAIETGMEITNFYIGKTYIRGRKGCKFNHMNPYTWRKLGISDRWRTHKRQFYGENGLVVLSVVTRGCMTVEGVHQEEYTLELERRLLHHYKEIKRDKRLVNPTYNSGKKTESSCVGYAIYVAFSLGHQHNIEPEESSTDDEANTSTTECTNSSTSGSISSTNESPADSGADSSTDEYDDAKKDKNKLNKLVKNMKIQ